MDKRQNLKDNLPIVALVIVAVAIWVVCLTVKNDSYTVNNTAINNPPVNNTPISDNDRAVNLIKQNISNREFTNNAHGFTTSIKFEPSSEDAPCGAAIMTQLNGHIVYTYEIDGNNINIKYSGSDCGRTANDQTLYYDLSDKCVYTFVDGQRFEFK